MGVRRVHAFSKWGGESELTGAWLQDTPESTFRRRQVFTELPGAYSIDVAVAHRWFVGGWLQTRSPEVREKTTPAVNNGRGFGDGLIAGHDTGCCGAVTVSCLGS